MESETNRAVYHTKCEMYIQICTLETENTKLVFCAISSRNLSKFSTFNVLYAESFKNRPEIRETFRKTGLHRQPIAVQLFFSSRLEDLVRSSMYESLQLNRLRCSAK